MYIVHLTLAYMAYQPFTETSQLWAEQLEAAGAAVPSALSAATSAVSGSEALGEMENPWVGHGWAGRKDLQDAKL